MLLVFHTLQVSYTAAESRLTQQVTFSSTSEAFCGDLIDIVDLFLLQEVAPVLIPLLHHGDLSAFNAQSQVTHYKQHNHESSH